MVFALVNLVDKIAVERRVWNTYAYTAVIGIFEMCIGAVELGSSNWDNFNDSNRSMVVWPLLGGLVDGCSLYLYFILLGLTDASIVVGVMYMYPAVVCVLSYFVLGEQLNIPGYLGVVILLAGAIILSINGIGKIVAKCRPNAAILIGLEDKNSEHEREREHERKAHEHDTSHIVCWYPTPHKVYNCLCRCRDCDDVQDEDDDAVLGSVAMEDVTEWKRHKSNQNNRKESKDNGSSCLCCDNCNNEDDLSSPETSEVSDMSDARPSMDRALDDISKDLGSDAESNSDSFSSNVIVAVVPTRPTPYRKRASVNAARMAERRRAAAAAAAAGAVTTEDSDSSASVSRHSANRPHQKRKKIKMPAPVAQESLPKQQEEPSPKQQQQSKPKRHPKFTKNVEDSDEEDDDADVDSDDEEEDEEDSSDEESNDEVNDSEKKKEKDKEQEKENKEEKEEEEGGEGKEKEDKEEEQKVENKKEERKHVKKDGKHDGKRKKTKKGVQVPTVKDDDKAGESEARNKDSKQPVDNTDPKSLEEGSKLQSRKNAVRSHKRYVGRKASSPRPFDLDDLSSTTDDVRSSMDERTESDNGAMLRTSRRHRYNLPADNKRLRRDSRSSSIEVQPQIHRKRTSTQANKGRTRIKVKGTTSESDSARGGNSSSSARSDGRNRNRNKYKKHGKNQVEEKKKGKQEEEDQEEEKGFCGCIPPGVLFAILAVPMVFATGGYEFLIALGAKMGMRTFQVSGVEISVQGFTLTMGAWLTKEGRRCFAHEFTWNWLFAFLNASLTICSQLLTVYSLTALPAAVSSSMCALQPLGILILETVTSVTSFRVSQCLAFKLPPIILIVTGVALLSLDVLMA